MGDLKSKVSIPRVNSYCNMVIASWMINIGDANYKVLVHEVAGKKYGGAILLVRT